MTKSNLVAVGVAMLALIMAVVVLLRLSRDPIVEEHTARPAPPVPPAASAAAARPGGSQRVGGRSAWPDIAASGLPAPAMSERERPEASGEDTELDEPVVETPPASGQVVSIRAGQVLATVNHIPITLNDLVAVAADAVEHKMTVEEFNARLAKAIEAELTMQTARVRGVELTPEQQQRVQELREKHRESLEQYAEQGISWTSVGPRQLELETRQMTALLVQQNLVMLDSGLAPGTDPAQQALYEQKLRELLDQLRAGANVQVHAPLP
jgi:hypothetical protein